MAEIALAALYRGVAAKLSGGGELWASRVYAERAPATVIRPFVVFTWQGGGERNRLKKQDAEIVLNIKCIADTLSVAFTGAARLSALLNDMGMQDRTATNDWLLAGVDWDILTTTQESIIHMSELVDGADVYHEGFMLRVRMERK